MAMEVHTELCILDHATADVGIHHHIVSVLKGSVPLHVQGYPMYDQGKQILKVLIFFNVEEDLGLEIFTLWAVDVVPRSCSAMYQVPDGFQHLGNVKLDYDNNGGSSSDWAIWIGRAEEEPPIFRH